MTIAARGGEGSDCCWIRGQYAPGRRQAVQNLPVLGKGAFRGTAWFDRNNILPGVNSTMFNPVYGDMPVCTVYSGYGVKFPTRIKVSSAGFPTLDVSINSIKVTVAAKIAAPKGLRHGGGRLAMEKAADGVWHVRGGSHHNVAIKMKDHVILVGGPLGDGSAKAVLREVRKTIPRKPIRTVLNTHLHFDHSGGLRAAASEGILIATFRDNVKFFKAAYGGKDSINPDAYGTSGKRAKFITVRDKHVFTNFSRTVEMHRLVGNAHNNGLYVIYLPNEKILSVADAYSGRGLRKTPTNKMNA